MKVYQPLSIPLAESMLMPHSEEAGILPKYFHAYHTTGVCSLSTETVTQ